MESKPEIVEASAQQRNTDKANNSEINTKNIQVVQEQLSTVDNSEEESDLSPPSYHSSPYLPSYDEIAGANHEGAESLPQCTNVKYRLYHFRVMTRPPVSTNQHRTYNDFSDYQIDGYCMKEVSILLTIFCLVAFVNPLALCCTMPAYILARKSMKTTDEDKTLQYTRHALLFNLASLISPFIFYGIIGSMSKLF